MQRTLMTGIATLTAVSIFVFAGVGMAMRLADDHAAKAAAENLWTDLSLEDATAKAVDDGRILLVYATADWCPPCKHMERTTWVDPKVASWFAEHGIALKFDVDENRELSRQLGVRAMPTLFAYREGKLFDRVTGARSADQLIEWLENVKEGRSELDALRARAGERMDAEGKVDVRDRLNIARMLVDGGELEEATEEFLWLWDNMLDHAPSMVGVRGSFMISDIARLTRRYPPAMEAFRNRRAAYWPAIQAGTADRDEVLDWINLAEPVNEVDSIMEWFHAAKDDPKQRPLLAVAEHLLRDRLVIAQQWADLAVLYPDPQGNVQRHVQSLEAIKQAQDDERGHDMSGTMLRMSRQSVSYIYVACLASGNEEGAADVAGMWLDVDDSPEARQAFASIALRAGHVRSIHLQWLDEALEMGHHVRQLRREVAEALADSHT